MIYLALILAATISPVVAHHYYVRSKRQAALLLDLRNALRERDAAERDPARTAFECGYRLGLAARWDAVTSRCERLSVN